MKLQLLWAKSDPFHPLWCHLLDVAAVCEKLLPRFGGVSPLPDKWVALLAALHDIGKADPWFQNKDDECAARLRETGLEIPEWAASEVDDKRWFRHEVRSGKWIFNWLTREQGWEKRPARIVQDAVDGHHGDFSSGKACYAEGREKASWDSQRTALCQLVWDVLQPPPCALRRFDDASAAGAKLNALIVLADWIASNDELYPYDRMDRDVVPAAYFREARNQAEIVVRRLEFDAPPVARSTVNPTFRDVWPQFEGTPRPLQSTLEELCRTELLPGLAIIEAPMGEGKTEAAVYLAECWNVRAGRRGCYLALPTQATANQMHARYQNFLQKRRPDNASAPRLVHGMAWLIDEAAPDKRPQTFGGDDTQNQKAEFLAREWFRPARRALLAEDGVGTVDQALLAALHVKFGFLRLLGLSAKTLVIDEVHAYDDYMTAIMKRLLAWCRTMRISVILLSATLSREQKRALCEAYAGSDRRSTVSAMLDGCAAENEPYPLLTIVPLDAAPNAVPVAANAKRTRRVRLQPHPGRLDDAPGTAALAADLVRGGGCVCVMVNTVRAAQDVFESLMMLKIRGELADTELLLFHARFRAEKRNEIERRVTDLFGKEAGGRRPERAILVATQVVEQSLDVDLDVMVTQLAPVDLLLQRSGRLWRHERNWRGAATEPVLHVLLPSDGSFDFGASQRVYARETLLRTLSLLHGRTAFDLPTDFRPLIEGCYARGPLPNDLIPAEELNAAAQKRDEERDAHRSLARTHLLPDPRPDVFEMARQSAGEAEGEGQAHSYFVAQTRLGDKSRAVLVLHDSELLALALTDLDEANKPRRDQRPPPRKRQKRLFLQKVNIPAWWLLEVAACEGYEPFFEGQAWLRGHLILHMLNGEWRGRDAKGREFLIRDDPLLGLQRLAITPEGEASKGAANEEADAGQTS
jgi:CRISPR-associated endonuclease/helicase Cas3